MNRCHLAVSLAIVWYLVLPPSAGDKGVNSSAPLPQWSRAAQYTSEADCLQAKRNFVRVAVSRGDSAPAQAMLELERSLCVSADDYRLEAGQARPTSTN
jgi:hypothetical protein